MDAAAGEKAPSLWRRSCASRGGESARRRRGASLAGAPSLGRRVGGTHRGGGSRASSEEGAREAGLLAGGAAPCGRERVRERDRGLLDLGLEIKI